MLFKYLCTFQNIYQFSCVSHIQLCRAVAFSLHSLSITICQPLYCHQLVSRSMLLLCSSSFTAILTGQMQNLIGLMAADFDTHTHTHTHTHTPLTICTFSYPSTHAHIYYIKIDMNYLQRSFVLNFG